MKQVRFAAKSAPVVFALLTVGAYGLLLPYTGFYWDDWPFAWIARFLGPSAFIPAFQGFRPFLGPIFFLTTSLIPADPRLWQLFALVIRFLAVLTAWLALREIWPRYRQQTLVIALLLLVFPGYSQHWVSFTHINQEWISFICYLASFGFTARALRSPTRYVTLTGAALLLMAVGLFPTEYFIGLEPLRFLFIWVIAGEGVRGVRQHLVKALRAWWPYLLVWLVDVVWLIFYYRSGAYVSYDLTAAQSSPALNQTVLVFLDALWKAGFYVWVQVLVLLARSITAPTSLITAGLIIVAFVLIAYYLQRVDWSSPAHGTSGLPDDIASAERRADGLRHFAIPAVIIGTAGLLLGRVPSFAAGLPLTLQSSFDRFMISMMLGACLLMAGLMELILPNQRLRIFACAALVALGVGQQFFNANIFRRDWQRQQQIYSQFAWRIPALKPGTAIITQQMPLDYETDLSMTAALNWIYAKRVAPPQLAYAMVYSEKRLGGIVLPDLKPGTPMHLPFRTMDFVGSTSQVVVVYVPQNGCLRVLDPAYNDQETYSRFPDSVTAPIPLSNPSLILTDGSVAPLAYPPFGEASTHSWCFFYEKAELARQTQDWRILAQIGDRATEAGLKPEDAFEWLPFIEGYARSGNLSKAQQITRQAWTEDQKLHRGLCGLWIRLRSDAPSDAQRTATIMTEELACGQ